jgi:3-oxoacyl-[acyl-carrier protein] reductase
MRNLNGKNCLITGAASGIGRSMALLLAKEGTNLLLVDINKERLDLLEKELTSFQTKNFSFICNISKLEQLQELKTNFYSKFDKLDLLINNAGIGGGGFAESLEIDDWKHVLDINLWSIIYSIKGLKRIF